MVCPVRIEKCCLTETTEPGPEVDLIHTQIVFFLTTGVKTSSLGSGVVQDCISE